MMFADFSDSVLTLTFVDFIVVIALIIIVCFLWGRRRR